MHRKFPYPTLCCSPFTDLNELDSNNACSQSKSLPCIALETRVAKKPIIINGRVELSEHVASVLGPRYEMQDFRCRSLTSLGRHSSGVVCKFIAGKFSLEDFSCWLRHLLCPFPSFAVLGLSSGLKKMPQLGRKPLLRVYHLTGQFGTSTENHLPDSLITAKARFRHVHPNTLSSLVASMQATHQRQLYEMHGVDLQSQAAYEIACRGMLPPSDSTLPILYGIKLIDFQSPAFTLEVHAINESEMYLAALIHDLALEVRTVAHCTAIRCIRVGQYRVEDSLLRHGWKLPGVVKNLRENRKKITFRKSVNIQ